MIPGWSLTPSGFDLGSKFLNWAFTHAEDIGFRSLVLPSLKVPLKVQCVFQPLFENQVIRYSIDGIAPFQSLKHNG